MSTPNTLLQLLSNYRIEIPRVQRDYVQGRKDDEHSVIVRKNLLKDIKRAFNDEIDPLDLHFVYGKTTDDDTFYPVDGQQRLTTLFLLHLFVFADDSSKDELFHKFSYQARTTTRDFFEALVNSRGDVFNSFELPETIIRDAAWFIDSWNYDPSVSNALTMLNDIVKMDFDCSKLKKCLEDCVNPKVFFQFVKLEELGMEDDLYIKLNARGRALTAFESFKSRFVDRCTEVVPSLSPQIKNNLDGIWADVIWDINNCKDESFDDCYLRLFETLFLNHGLLLAEANKTVSRNWFHSLDYTAIPVKIINTINNTLNYLANNKASKAYKLIVEAIEKDSSYPEKVLFHAVSTYLEDESDVANVDISLLNDWLRVISNLTENSRIDEADDYYKAINSINLLLPYKNTIISHLATGNIKELPGFQQDQVEEECIKAKIMSKGNSFKKAITDAEGNLPYFGNQIRSVLYFSDIENKSDITLLSEYVNRISILFNSEKPANGCLLRRALCSIGDYRLPVGNYKTLCIDDNKERSRTPSLKKLFSSHGKEVTTLVNSIDCSKPIESQLQDIIKKYSVDQNDWRYCIINFYDVLFPLMSPFHLRMCDNNTEELIVPNKQSNGENYSIYLTVLKTILEKRGIMSEYFTEKGAWGNRYLSVKDYVVKFSKGNYYITNDTSSWQTNGQSIIDEAVKYIESL